MKHLETIILILAALVALCITPILRRLPYKLMESGFSLWDLFRKKEKE